ncbi:hypothetical protein PR048_017165 [Dryococelus australis]|uniref:Uncharacterized protein n=1 Tax=Dryococelus australis TaxID=614101 RepID=A0ABQ9H8R3_9NEOP|nr:hypothetical protein PR048_017165 [Dryococelus australis]
MNKQQDCPFHNLVLQDVLRRHTEKYVRKEKSVRLARRVFTEAIRARSSESPRTRSGETWWTLSIVEGFSHGSPPNWASVHNDVSVFVTPLESRRVTSCSYNSSHYVWHALYECLQDIHGDSSPFLLQPFHELSNGFWPQLTSPHPAIQFVPKMFYRVEVGALGGPVQSANIVFGPSVFMLPRTNTSGPTPKAVKQPHTINPPPPNFLVGTIHSGRSCSPGRRHTHTRPSDRNNVNLDSSLHRTDFHCYSVQLRRSKHHVSRRALLLVVIWDLSAALPKYPSRVLRFLSVKIGGSPERAALAQVPSTFHLRRTNATVDLGLFIFHGIVRPDSPLRWQPTITPLSKSDSFVTRAISLSTGSTPACSKRVNHMGTAILRHKVIAFGSHSRASASKPVITHAVLEIWAALNIEFLRANEVEARKDGGNGRSPRKPTDQWHSSARFPRVKINPVGNRTRYALMGGERFSRCATADRTPDSAALCANIPKSTVHWLYAVTVEGDDWVNVLQETTPCGPMAKTGTDIATTPLFPRYVFLSVRATPVRAYFRRHFSHLIRAFRCPHSRGQVFPSIMTLSTMDRRRKVTAVLFLYNRPRFLPLVPKSAFFATGAAGFADPVFMASGFFCVLFSPPILFHWDRARWRSGNSLDSHSGGHGFDSWSGHPDLGFPWFSKITPGECWDGSQTRAIGFKKGRIYRESTIVVDTVEAGAERAPCGYLPVPYRTVQRYQRLTMYNYLYGRTYRSGRSPARAKIRNYAYIATLSIPKHDDKETNVDAKSSVLTTVITIATPATRCAQAKDDHRQPTQGLVQQELHCRSGIVRHKPARASTGNYNSAHAKLSANRGGVTTRYQEGEGARNVVEGSEPGNGVFLMCRRREADAGREGTISSHLQGAGFVRCTGDSSLESRLCESAAVASDFRLAARMLLTTYYHSPSRFLFQAVWLVTDKIGCSRITDKVHYRPKSNLAPVHNVSSVVVPPIEYRRAASCGYNSSHPVWHALYECLQDICGYSSPFLLQPFHELSNGFWPRLMSPHPAIRFVPKMFYRAEVGSLGGPVRSPQCWEHFIIHNPSVFMLPRTNTSGPTPKAVKQPHAITPTPPNFLVGTIHSGRSRSPGRRHAHARPSDWNNGNLDSSLHRTDFHCSSVQLGRSKHHLSRRALLLVVIWGLCAAALLKYSSRVLRFLSVKIGGRPERAALAQVPSTFHLRRTNATVDLGLFIFHAIIRPDSPLRWQPTITPYRSLIALYLGSSPCQLVQHRPAAYGGHTIFNHKPALTCQTAVQAIWEQSITCNSQSDNKACFHSFEPPMNDRVHLHPSLVDSEAVRDGRSFSGKRDWARNGKGSDMAFVRDPSQHSPGRYNGNTARLARRSDEALGVRVNVTRIAHSLLDLGRADK